MRKIIAGILIITFLAQDIVWTDPDILTRLPVSANTLSVYSKFCLPGGPLDFLIRGKLRSLGDLRLRVGPKTFLFPGNELVAVFEFGGSPTVPFVIYSANDTGRERPLDHYEAVQAADGTITIRPRKKNGKPAVTGNITWAELIADTARLSRVEAFINDFDGVDRDRNEAVSSKETIAAKTALARSGVRNITISGLPWETLEQRFGGAARVARMSGAEPYLTLTNGGAEGWAIDTGGSVVDIAERCPGFTKAKLGSLDAVSAVAQEAQTALREAIRAEGIDATVQAKIRMKVNEAGVTLYVEDDPAVQKIRLKIARLLRARIEAMKAQGTLSPSAEVVASQGGVDVVATSKGAAALQMIKLLNLKHVILMADSVGTKEDPGNDRSLLELDREQLKQAGIAWDVELI
ncbi:MAG: hypothetical protein PHS37_04260, partial [Candidatus Omnitrophica bacterium]|nr:hypothetical protein [Candidatus Omnitrophota bacterium]